MTKDNEMRLLNGSTARGMWAAGLLLATGLLIMSSVARSVAAGPAEYVKERELPVVVKVSGFRRDLETGDLVQMVKITNRGSAPLQGPFHLVLRGLETSAAVKSVALQGRVRSAGPLTLEIEPESPGGLKPNEQLTLLLRFDGQQKRPLKYEAIVVPTT
jgi:hypothetical protein